MATESRISNPRRDRARRGLTEMQDLNYCRFATSTVWVISKSFSHIVKFVVRLGLSPAKQCGRSPENLPPRPFSSGVRHRATRWVGHHRRADTRVITGKSKLFKGLILAEQGVAFTKIGSDYSRSYSWTRI